MPETSETQFHQFPDGRILAYIEYGDKNGYPVFYAHGGPGSRLECILFQQKAAEYGFRLIATDRPGMGQSTYLPERTLLDYPKDIAALADALNIDQFGVIGWSGGGAHTTVCAYALAERLAFCIPLCGYTNFAELPDAASYLAAPADRMAVGLSKTQPFLFRMMFELMALGIKFLPNQYFSELLKTVNETDKKIINDAEFKAHFIADQKEALSQGGKGASTDAAVHYVDWRFRLNEIACKVHIFHGTEDRLVPVEYARHLAENIPDVEMHWLEGQGHLFPYVYQDLIFQTARSEIDS